MAIDHHSNRTVQAGLVFEYLDLFDVGGARVTGVTSGDLQVKLLFGSTDTEWSLVSGVGVADINVVAGKVYCEEFEAGYYSLRFFPNRVGTWRLLLTWAAGGKTFSYLYDVTPKSEMLSAGLVSTFVKSSGG